MSAVRSVTVRLSANTSEYLAKMRGAASVTEATGASMSRSMTRHSAESAAALNKLQSTAMRVGKWTGLSIAGGMIMATKAAADFAEKQALVDTLAHSTPREAQMLAASARDVGTAYGYTAMQVSDAQAELVKAGISTKDLLGGALKGALTLAAAGQTDVAQATEYAAAAMTQFRLKGKDVPHIADLLAAGADKALGSVSDLGYGLSQVGTTAHQSGLSIEQTVGTLAAFAQAGLTGERGGTVFKQMLLQLQSPTKKAQDLMDEYHLSLYNANGEMKKVPQIAQALQDSFSHLTPEQRNYALGVIFGSRAIQGANILMAEGSKGIRRWINDVNDQGFAAGQASGKLNSLKGDLTKLKAEGLDALIELGDGSQAPLRKLVQNITHWLHEARVSGDLKRWGTETVRVLQQIADVGASVGRGLVPVAKGVGQIIAAFTKLPSGLQKTLLTGAVVGYAAKKTGVLDLATSLLLPGKKGVGGGLASRSGVVPVFVTNPGFGGEGGVPGVGGRGGRGGAKVPPLLAASPYLLPLLTSGDSASGQGMTRKQQTDFEVRNALWAALNKITGRSNDPADPSSHISQLAGSNPTRALAELKKAASTAGVPWADAKNSAAFKGWVKQIDEAVKKQKGLNDLLLAPALPTYTKRLKSLPPMVQTAVKTPGVVESLSDVSDLARAYNLTPKQIVTLARLSGAKGSMADIKALARQYGLTPRQVQTLIRLQGADSALALIAQVKAAMASIHDKDVRLNYYVNQVNARSKPQVLPGNPDGTGADGATIPKTGRPYGDRHLYLLADGERVTSNRHGQVDKSHRALDLINQGRLNDHILGLADGGRARTRPGGDGSGRDRSKPLFTHEGPRWYAAAYRHNRAFAKAGPSHRDWPYQTGLTANQERAFERWVSKRHVPFDPNEQITDYDMRGYWKKTRGRGWHVGSHFPDTYKTPYDTTFSHESKYATKNNPFFWHGNKLIDQRNGQVIFAADGNTVPKTGRGYADRHLYLLADGEEVITNRHGEADRHRSLLKTINAGRLAEGGTVRGPGVSAEVSFYSGSGAAAASKPPTTKVHIDGVGTFTVTETDVKNAKYIARLSHQTLVEKHADRLSELQAEQHVRDLRRSLTAMAGKKGHRHLALTGLDRKEAQAELAAALDDLKAIRDHSDAAKQAIEQVRQAQADARKQAQEERQQAKADALSSVRGNLDVFSRGLSATGALSSVTRMVADITTYGQLLGQLRAKNVSPVLLDQIVQHANGGDFAGAIRLMRSLLNSPATLAQVNSALGQYSTVTNQVANLTSDPRFASGAAWAGATQVVKSNTIQFNFAQNPTALLTELQRVVQHYVQAEMAKAGA